MTGVILAAGDGTRLKKDTDNAQCKALQKINGKELVDYALDNLIATGIDKVCIVVGKEGHRIISRTQEMNKPLDITYAKQEKQNGLINAFVCALGCIDEKEDIVLALADEIFDGFRADCITESYKNKDIDFFCGITYEENPQLIKNNFSVEADGDGILKKCIEKPDEVINNMKGTGFCFFRRSTVRMLKNIYDAQKNMPCDLCDFMNYLVNENKKGIVLQIADKEFNINTLSDLENANRYFEEKQNI